MNRLTDNDRQFGPITYGPWRNTFRITWGSGGGEEQDPRNRLLVAGFGWCARIYIPKILKPWMEVRKSYCNPQETISIPWEREYGVSLSNMGNGYDFLQVSLGAKTHDSSTSQDWCCHLPWKQWSCVRHSMYEPDGTHFFTEETGKHPDAWFRFHKKREECPVVHFLFEDYDGEKIIATCRIEEREWHKGSGWFKWLKWFSKPRLSRSLDLDFNHEVGPEKGSWKGGAIGHGVEMLPGEYPINAFKRYCEMEKERKGRKYHLKYIGPCGPPEPKEKPYKETTEQTGTIQ